MSDWHCKQIITSSPSPIVVCEREALLAEIERLRDALKEITSMPSLKSTEEEWRRVAKRALKGTP